MNQKQKIQIVEDSLYYSVVPKPGATIIQRSDWVQNITPEDSSVVGNAVYRSVLKPEEAEEKVKQIIALYQANQSSFRWVVSPITQPNHLPDILLKHGLTLGYMASGMVLEVDSPPPPSSSPLRVETASIDHVDDIVTVTLKSFPQYSAKPDALKKRFLNDLCHRPQIRYPFIGYVGTTPAAVLSYTNCAGRAAYVADGCVAPEHRGKGYMKALAIFMARWAVEHQNIHVFTTQAIKNVSEPIARKFGFESVCDTTGYYYTPKR